MALIDIDEDTDFYFFFQAEDGIRDFHVTGVQTCALPISSGPCRANALDVLHDASESILDDALRTVLAGEPVIERELDAFLSRIRSEERRVGKECRALEAPYVSATQGL